SSTVSSLLGSWTPSNVVSGSATAVPTFPVCVTPCSHSVFVPVLSRYASSIAHVSTACPATFVVIEVSRLVLQNVGEPNVLLQFAVHCRSHGVSGQLVASCVSQLVVRHRSPVVKTTWAGGVPAGLVRPSVRVP